MKRHRGFRLGGMGLLLCLATMVAMAQPRGGQIGTFTYTEAQGLPAENVTDLSQLPDGSLVVKHYSTAQLYRLQATITKLLWYGSGLKGLEGSLYASGGQGLWQGTRGFAQLLSDSLQLTLPKEELGPLVHLPMGNGSMALQHAYDRPALGWLRQQQWISIPLPAAITDSASLVYDLNTGLPCLLQIRSQPPLNIYRFDTSSRRFRFLASYPVANPFGHAYVFGADSIWVHTGSGAISLAANGQRRNLPDFAPLLASSGHIPLQGGQTSLLYDHSRRSTWRLPFEERIASTLGDAYYHSIYVGTYLHLRRLFPHISTYPSLYGPGNSLATHNLMQTADGHLYAASYAGALTQLRPDGYAPVAPWVHRFLPGGLGIGGQLFFFSEYPVGLYCWQPGNQPSRIGPANQTGYYLTYSADSSEILAGFGGSYRFGITPKAALAAGQPQWQWVDSSMGMRLANVVTLCEDRHGRIWFGRNSQGWGVYDRRSRKAQTWLMAENQTAFGGICSLADSYGHVFMGGSRGLWFADAAKPGPVAASAMQQVHHPLLEHGALVGSMKQWGKYLVIACGQHFLLLDLEAFARNPQKPKVLYWHPQETNFSGTPEQNTMLIDRQDSSIWLSSSKMVYQMDLRSWLQLPHVSIEPTCRLIAAGDTMTLSPGKTVSLDPDITSIELQWPYQPIDNFPRYIQTALLAKGDSMVWSLPSFETQLAAKNKRQGEYLFHLRILQQDGTTTTYSYPITIRPFLWQQWWFWLAITALVTLTGSYLLDLKRKKQLAEARAIQMQAEAEALKSEQHRQLTGMQVKSLSNQFRPHFILNALNTIGAQLYDKPEVDDVLGQLGDSIGIIFRSAQQGTVAHNLQNEWKLVQSVINIKQMEYRQAVQVHLSGTRLVEDYPDWLLPMGILQIPVENALVHGLRNKSVGTKDLWITLQMADDALEVTIADNGVGLKQAAAMSNHRSNGVGTANLLSIIRLLNTSNKRPITYQITDNFPEGTTQPVGTRVQVLIPKTYNYVL